ncbi:hypothetical protein BH18ACI4_BH18ACI4_22500 [soil metagenome]
MIAPLPAPRSSRFALYGRNEDTPETRPQARKGDQLHTSGTGMYEPFSELLARVVTVYFRFGQKKKRYLDLKVRMVKRIDESA